MRKKINFYFILILTFFDFSYIYCNDENITSSNVISLDNWYYCYSEKFEPKNNHECNWKKWTLKDIQEDRKNRNIVWLKTYIPEIYFDDPVIYFDSIDFNFDLYLEREIYYRYGRFDKEGKVIFNGWPIHIISINKNFSNKFIYLKVYSIDEYPDIGIWKKQIIINKANLYQYLLKNFFSYAIISLIFFFASILSFSFYLTNKRLFYNLHFSLISFFMGCYLFFSPNNQFLHIIYSQPLIYFVIENLSTYLLVILFSKYLLNILELKQKNIKYLLNFINYLFLLLIILGLFLIIFYRNKFFELHYYANIFIVLALLIFLIIILSRILYYDIDAIYLLIGSTAVFISGFLELGIYFRIFNFINVFHIGCLIFLFFNFIVLSKKYWNTYQKLEESNKILKEQQKQIELLQNLKDEFFIELSNKIIFPIEDIISLLKNIEIDLSEKEMLIKLLDNLRRETNRIKNLLTYERNEFNLESLELNIIEYLKNIHFLTSQNENKNLEVFIPQVKEAWILFNHEILIEIFNELFFYSSGNIKILVDIQTNNDKEYIIIQINSENIYMYPEIRNYFQPYLKIDFLETTGLYLVYKYMKYFNGNFEYSINHSEIKFILYFPLINTTKQQIENSNQILSKKEKNSFILKSSIRKEIPKIIFLYDDPLFLKKIYNILKSDYYIFCTNDINVVIEELKSEYDIFIFPPILFGNPILSFFKDIRKQYDPFSLIAILLNPVSNVKWEEYQNFGIQDIIIIEKNKVNEEEIKLKLFNYILLKKYYKKFLDYLKYQNDINILSEFQNHFYKDYSLYKNSIEYDIKYLAADQISGDLVEIYKKSESEIIFIIGDITGHGLYAAFFSIFLRMLITIYIQENPNISGIDLLKKINKMIINYFNKQLATLSLLFIDIQNKILKFYRAGHLPALYYKKNSNEFIELFPRGKILGVSENANWEELMIHYNLGDRIFLYTDGLIETAFENNSNKIYNLIKENNHKLRIDDLSNIIFSEVIKNKSYKEKFIEDDITSIFIELK